MNLCRTVLAAFVMLIGVTFVCLDIAAGGQTDPGKKSEVEKTRSVRGTIQLVDNDRVKVRPDGGGDAVIARVGGETKISIDGKDGTLTDLRPGQDVTCVFVTRERVNVCLALMARKAKK